MYNYEDYDYDAEISEDIFGDAGYIAREKAERHEQDSINFLQSKLDKEKYFASQRANTDLSGKMSYCEHCRYKTENGCCIGHDERVYNRACAESFLERY